MHEIWPFIALCLSTSGVSATKPHHPQGLIARLRDRGFAPVDGPRPVSNDAQQTTRIVANSTISSSTASEVLRRGRYGHSSIYVPSENTVLFIGGQVGESGTFITNDISALDLNKPYPSNINPRTASDLTVDLLPNAWAASVIDRDDRIWVIGGVTQDCSADSLAMTLKDHVWTSITASEGSSPPRRRQAQAVLVNTQDTDSQEIWVWGGIAEPYTCSLETVGYMGLDQWNATSRTAKTYAWSTFAKSNTSMIPYGYKPPISDYAAVLLDDGKSIAYIGGQTAQGDYVDMQMVLVFDTCDQTWRVQKTLGQIPDCRIGHIAIRIDDDRILMHGGVDSEGQPTGQVSFLNTNSWKWDTPKWADATLKTPRRVYHSAVRASSGTVIIGFGLDGLNATTARSSSDIFFFSGNDDEGWSWSNSHSPELAKATRTKAASNPDDQPAQTYIAPPPSTNLFTSEALQTGSSTPAVAGTTKPQPGVLVASAIGGLFAFALVGGALLVYSKKRAAAAAAENDQPMSQDDAPPVSTLLFTRPAPRRSITLDTHSDILPDEDDADSIKSAAETTPQTPQPNAAGIGLSSIPMASPTSSRGTLASVTSYPFLTAVPMLGRSKSSGSIESDKSSYSTDSAISAVSASTLKPLILHDKNKTTEYSQPISKGGLMDFFKPLRAASTSKRQSSSTIATTLSSSSTGISHDENEDPYTTLSSALARRPSADARISTYARNQLSKPTTKDSTSAVPASLQPGTPQLNNIPILRVTNASLTSPPIT